VVVGRLEEESKLEDEQERQSEVASLARGRLISVEREMGSEI
jgi:hypothetical protein